MSRRLKISVLDPPGTWDTILADRTLQFLIVITTPPYLRQPRPKPAFTSSTPLVSLAPLVLDLLSTGETGRYPEPTPLLL